MSQIRNSIMSKLVASLESGVFTQYDFTFSFPEEGDTLFSASFIGQPKYSFELMDSDEDGEWLVLRSPGEFRNEEEFHIQHEGTIYEKLKEWTRLIREDLRSANYTFREIQDTAEELEKKIRDHITDPDKHLSRDEIDVLNSKFDDLLAKFEKLREDNAITQTELDRLKSEIASFKINAETFPKGTFVRTTFNRLRRIITSEKTKEVVKDLITSAVKTTMGLPY
jgi:hypothetical protein